MVCSLPRPRFAALISNVSGIATGDDGVGYRAIADSLLRGDGYGYFLEGPVTVWPPIWPSLMARWPGAHRSTRWARPSSC